MYRWPARSWNALWFCGIDAYACPKWREPSGKGFPFDAKYSTMKQRSSDGGQSGFMAAGSFSAASIRWMFSTLLAEKHFLEKLSLYIISPKFSFISKWNWELCNGAGQYSYWSTVCWEQFTIITFHSSSQVPLISFHGTSPPTSLSWQARTLKIPILAFCRPHGVSFRRSFTLSFVRKENNTN